MTTKSEQVSLSSGVEDFEESGNSKIIVKIDSNDLRSTMIVTTQRDTMSDSLRYDAYFEFFSGTDKVVVSLMLKEVLIELIEKYRVYVTKSLKEMDKQITTAAAAARWPLLPAAAAAPAPAAPAAAAPAAPAAAAAAAAAPADLASLTSKKSANSIVLTPIHAFHELKMMGIYFRDLEL